MTFAGCIPEFDFTSPTFLIENNNLPFDQIIQDKVLEYCKKNKLKTEKSKTILYKNYKDSLYTFSLDSKKYRKCRV